MNILAGPNNVPGNPFQANVLIAGAATWITVDKVVNINVKPAPPPGGWAVAGTVQVHMPPFANPQAGLYKITSVAGQDRPRKVRERSLSANRPC